MPAPHPDLPVEFSLLRICAQGLVPATASPTVTHAVRSMFAIQGQQVSAVPHALILRAPGAVRSDVVDAFNNGNLVRHRPMRGTVHITTAEDYHWMRQTLKCRYEANNKERDSLGLDEAALERGADIAWQAIAQNNGQITRPDLFKAWEQNMDTRHLADATHIRRWCQWLKWSLDSRGAVIEGPMGKNSHSFIDARTLPAADSITSGFRMRPDDLDQGRAEVARRYIVGHGPVSIDDFARWANLPLGVATTAMETALEESLSSRTPPRTAHNTPCSREAHADVYGSGDAQGYGSGEAQGGTYGSGDALGEAHGSRDTHGDLSTAHTTSHPQLVRVTWDGTRLIPANKPSTPQQRAQVFYMRADLPDLLTDSRSWAEALMFLPAFDELHIGYLNRTCLTDDNGEYLMCPTRNGLLRPFAITGGQLIAVRSVKEGLQWVETPTSEMEKELDQVIEALDTALKR